jgi:hypothetical protein
VTFERAIDRTLRLAAAVLVAAVFVASLHDVSQAWDVWYYHMPFAARLAGLVPTSAFTFHAANEARFAGFPLLAEAVQGLLWRVTGRPESANFVAFACVPLFAWFVRRRLDVPIHLTVLGILAVPLVMAHATSTYIDLPANTAAAVLVLLAIEAYAKPAPPAPHTLLLAGFAAAVAVNTKVLTQPLVLVALIALGCRALPSLLRDRAWRTLGVVVLASPVVFATPLKNLIAHRNPYFPVRFSLFGQVLPGPEEPYSFAPPWLAHAPQPVRFACSVLELGIRPFSDPRRWTVDQWMPPESTGCRLGGFFGAYVIVLLVVLAWRVLRERDRVARAAGLGFAGLTAIVALMPQSHELRYYMVWMLVLVAVNLWLACREHATSVPLGKTGLGVVSLAALVIVLGVTRGAYAYPSGASFAELLREKVDAKALAETRDGERICVQREPYNLLWAAPFHPPRHYAVKEAEEEGECAGARPIASRE